MRRRRRRRPGTAAGTTSRCSRTSPTAADVIKLEETSTATRWPGSAAGPCTCSLGENYHEAKLTNAAVEKQLGVATNRNLTVIRALAEKWGDG